MNAEVEDFDGYTIYKKAALNRKFEAAFLLFREIEPYVGVQPWIALPQ